MLRIVILGRRAVALRAHARCAVSHNHATRQRNARTQVSSHVRANAYAASRKNSGSGWKRQRFAQTHALTGKVGNHGGLEEEEGDALAQDQQEGRPVVQQRQLRVNGSTHLGLKASTELNARVPRSG